MTEAALTIPFANRTVTEQSCFKIEQKPWPRDIGETTQLQGIAGIIAAAHGSKWPAMRCGGLNGIFTAEVYVYPCDRETPFQFRVSHGTIRSSRAETAYREEAIQCSMQLEHTPQYPVSRMGSVAWIGHCYDETGNVTSRPAVTLDGSVIRLSKEVYGTIRLRYTVFRHIYTVEVSKRLLALENKYQAVAYIVWDGGVKWCDVEAPANFEQFDGECGNGGNYGDGGDGGGGGSVIINPPGDGDGDDGLPTASGKDRKIVYDYCTQELISDSLD